MAGRFRGSPLINGYAHQDDIKPLSGGYEPICVVAR